MGLARLRAKVSIDILKALSSGFEMSEMKE